jgi:hypothetical protein
MKNFAKVALTTVAAATLAITVSAGNAAATNETACTSSQFLRIDSAHGSFCFANGGAPVTDYQIDKVTHVSSGNNVVQLRDAKGRTYSLKKHANIRFGGGITINYIDIV